MPQQCRLSLCLETLPHKQCFPHLQELFLAHRYLLCLGPCAVLYTKQESSNVDPNCRALGVVAFNKQWVDNNDYYKQLAF